MAIEFSIINKYDVLTGGANCIHSVGLVSTIRYLRYFDIVLYEVLLKEEELQDIIYYA